MLKCFLKIAVPSTLTNILLDVPDIVNVMAAGHMDRPIHLASMGLACSCRIMILSFFIGINGAQETFSSQAFGAGNLQLCGVYLNRGMLILIAFFLPIALIAVVFGEEILLALG